MGSGLHSHQQELLKPKQSPRQQFFSSSSAWAPAPCHSHSGLHHPLQPPVPHLRSCVFSDFPLTPPFQVYPGPTWRNRPPGANSDPREHGLGVPPASSLSSGTSYYGLSWWGGLPSLEEQPLDRCPGHMLSRGIVFPPGCALSHSHLLLGFCELIREKEGEEGDAACLPRYLQQSTVTNAPSW